MAKPLQEAGAKVSLSFWQTMLGTDTTLQNKTTLTTDA